MNHDLVKFPMSAEFVLTHALPTPCELAYGYEHGWLGRSAAVQVALAGYGKFLEPPPAYEELALLLSDSFYRVPDLIREIVRANSSGEDCSRIWLYLALAWAYVHRVEYSDPLSIVEQLYADFDYPDEIEGFVRFLPVPQGLPTGEAALYRRWSEYLESSGMKYRSRYPQN
jgi:hypothetical protein